MVEYNNWTFKDGVSNASDEFLKLCNAVAELPLEGGGSVALKREWIDAKARLIIAQLAHIHNVGPLEENTNDT